MALLLLWFCCVCQVGEGVQGGATGDSFLASTAAVGIIIAISRLRLFRSAQLSE